MSARAALALVVANLIALASLWLLNASASAPLWLQVLAGGWALLVCVAVGALDLTAVGVAWGEAPVLEVNR